MPKQHERVAVLREIKRDSGFTMLPHQQEAIDWAIRVCEAADVLTNGKGRRPEMAYSRLEEAVLS